MVTLEQLVAGRLARAEARSPDDLIRHLERFVLEPRRTRLLQAIDQRLDSVTVVFDQPYDPHNGAAILRTCDAFGLQALHVVERPTTPFLAAASVARGANKWVDVLLHRSAASVVRHFAEAEVATPLVAAHPEGELLPEDLAALPRMALVVGNEREGIQPELAAACTHRVRVPMRGFVESLNVSVSTAILLHGATRGRVGDLPEAQRRRLYARGLYFSVAQVERVLAVLEGEGGV